MAKERCEYIGGPLDGVVTEVKPPTVGIPFAVATRAKTTAHPPLYERTGLRTDNGAIILQFIGYQE